MNYDSLKTSMRALARKNVAKVLRNMQPNKQYSVTSFMRFFADSGAPYHDSCNTLRHIYRYGLLNRRTVGTSVSYSLNARGQEMQHIIQGFPVLSYNNSNLRTK